MTSLLLEEFGINPYSSEYKAMPIEEKIIARSRWEGGCVIFHGERSKEGYGRILHGRSRRFVHRIMWEHLVGPIPDRLQIDHLCRNEPCWWPDHLRVATPRQNNLASWNVSGRNARKTHCKRGHPLAGQNLRTEDGRRICLTCRRRADREGYHRRKRGTLR